MKPTNRRKILCSIYIYVSWLRLGSEVGVRTPLLVGEVVRPTSFRMQIVGGGGGGGGTRFFACEVGFLDGFKLLLSSPRTASNIRSYGSM
jgi:hypothetical protein